MSLVHGGPAPAFMSPYMVDRILGLTHTIIPSDTLSESTWIKQVRKQDDYIQYYLSLNMISLASAQMCQVRPNSIYCIRTPAITSEKCFFIFINCIKLPAINCVCLFHLLDHLCFLSYHASSLLPLVFNNYCANYPRFVC